MPLNIPVLDDRKYQDLLDEALARIPVHNPEWTNFNKSDPGITLIEVFAFLTESLLYRSNQIPERNRRKFLSLLGVPLQPASSARGLVTFSNERGPLQTITLNDGLEVRAGQVPFRTELGLDVLPIEAYVCYKRRLANPPDKLKEYYRQLYASYVGQPPGGDLLLYETVPFSPRDNVGIDLGREAVDGSLWIALLLRASDKPYHQTMDETRKAIAGRTLNLGVVPSLADGRRRLSPGGQANPEGMPLLQYEIPKIPAGGVLPATASGRTPIYRSLEASATSDVLAEPGVVQITLPSASELSLWSNLDPLEAGVGDFPPALQETQLNERVITWLRVRPAVAVRAQLLWVGINTSFVKQRAEISNELLPPGTGEPDQTVTLSRTPVISRSLALTVTANGKSELWQEMDDLLSAGPEVPVSDMRQPPGTLRWTNALVKAFTVNPESGEIRFGDGTHGARPPLGATLRASYAFGVGRAGNVGAGSINTSPALPAGMRVHNPVPTWGGAEGETVPEGERQIARYLQHRDRLVNGADFETITLRTPGVDIGRVEVIPAFNPELTPNEPGDAPGAVTVMVIPKYDPDQPDAPVPDRLFLNTICDYLNPRRLVTTEVFLRGPNYKSIWISVGINVVAGAAIAPVREAVKRALLRFLSPLPDPQAQVDRLDDAAALLTTPQYASMQKGWPLRKPVAALELAAVASRVPGVLLVNDVLLAEGNKSAQPQVKLSGLDLPRVAGISIAVGNPVGLDALRGQATGAGQTTLAPTLVPVPVIPEEC